MDNMIFTSEVCGVVLIAPFDKISRPPCSTIRFIVFLSLFFRCFSPFSLYHRTFSLTVTNIIYAALSSGVLAAVLAFPEFRRILFQSWLVVTDVFQLFLIILLFILLSKIAQLNRIRNGWRNEKRKEKNL